MNNKVIVIAQRGWVFIGDVNERLPHENEDDWVLENASVIRKWGTSKGIGQLALEGPQPNTILDACGTVSLHPLSIVATIEVKTPEKWT